MNNSFQDYGMWLIVILASAFVIAAVKSLVQPSNARDWRALGGFSAFIVALFAEMYGFPLTIYLLSGWLTTKFPGVDFFSHNAGHLLETLFGWRANPHFGPFHVVSIILIITGFSLLSNAWKVLYQAQRTRTLATAGPYARIRHPQYAAFIIIMIGFLVQWPTLLTLLMFPVLVAMYVRLARREERDARQAFGRMWDEYARLTPRWFPRWAPAAER